jgi:2-beta-glucuronyltransferase
MGGRPAAGNDPAAEHDVSGHVVIISDHDYRTARRASIHQIADAFVRLGHEVSFISVRFSILSRLRRDSRSFLWDRANAPETKNGVRCYLWRTPLHPINLKSPLLNAMSAPFYDVYARLPSRFVDDEIRSAALIVVESGLGAVLLRRARALNKSAKIVYRASDELKTVGVHPCVQTQLEKSAGIVDQFCVTSRKMAENFRWAGESLFFVPHGIRKDDFTRPCPNPYRSDLNAVSVGSMLFDADFFVHAARRFPEVMFHVIGAGRRFDAPGNVHQHAEMPFRETLPFLVHADIGIAPYRQAENCEYLCDTSLKLMQYEQCGVPAVCPTFAAGSNPNRFGYVPGDTRSIAAALEAALTHRDSVQSPRALTWEDVAHRLLDPRRFADTAMPH